MNLSLPNTSKRIYWFHARDTLLMLAFLLLSIISFALFAPQAISANVFRAIAYQLPELGLLTLAMFIPVLTGGLNLAVTYTANICALAAAALLIYVLPEAGLTGSVLSIIAALLLGAFIGALIGLMVAWVQAHPILVTLGAMILLRGIGEWVTRGGDISGMPALYNTLGHGSWWGLPLPLWIFILAVLLWVYLIHFTRLGFAVYMIGSNIQAAAYSGIHVKNTLLWVYALSGAMSALAGIIMLARFNSVRIGHGDSYLLITILACFLSGVNPFGGFGRVIPLAIALLALQFIASGLNVLGVNQHLVTAIWGLFLIVVMAMRSSLLRR